MVATLDREQVRTRAIGFFRRSELDEDWKWVEELSPVNLRLFAVEFADAVKEMVEDWKAPAELDAAPEVLTKVREAKKRLPVTKFATG